ncbi:hypothetical protein K501DRAFT_148994, partial [Backusella circina FSU 941]
LPIEIQESICRYIIEDNDNVSASAIVAIRVCKTWASILCKHIYRNYNFRSYIQFIGFVKTIACPSKYTVISYATYVQHLRLGPVNKYGVDSRVRKLIKYCPNILSITFGPSTTVAATTLQLMGRHCHKIRTVELGALQCFPFMFDCDFSGMKALRQITLSSTPLQASSLKTIPPTIHYFDISFMDALEYDELVGFLKSHRNIQTLKLGQCRYINYNFAKLVILLPHLQTLELTGPEIDDRAIEGLFDLPIKLCSLRICNTQITDKTLGLIEDGCIKIRRLDLSGNIQLTQKSV